jgi:hypothetical protein
MLLVIVLLIAEGKGQRKGSRGGGGQLPSGAPKFKIQEDTYCRSFIFLQQYSQFFETLHVADGSGNRPLKILVV